MRKLLAILLLSASAFATTSVSGHLSTLGTGSATSASGAFVRFWLTGCRGNQPRITASGAIAPQQGANSVFYFDVLADGSGNVSGTIYSTRDAAGTGNGEIECGGSYTSVWYEMQVVSNSSWGPKVPVHAKSGATLDPANVTPLTTQPVSTAGNGDTTYLQLTGGNSPVTGLTSFTGGIVARKLNGALSADQFIPQGGDISGGVAAAYAAASAGTCHITIPPGTWTVTSADPNPIYFNTASKPCWLQGSGMGQTTLVFPDLTGAVSFTNNTSGSTISDLTLQGANDGSAGVGINAGSAANISVFNVEITKFGIGINTGGSSSRWNIHGNNIHHNKGDGIFLAQGTSDSIVTHNQIHDNGANGIDVNGPRNAIIGNQVRNNGTDTLLSEYDRSGIFVQPLSGDVDGTIVANNDVTGHTGGRGITLRAAVGQSAAGVEIADNVVSGNAEGIYVDGSGVAGTIDSVSVHGNIVTTSSSHGIWINDTSTATISHPKVQGNISKGNTGYGLRFDGAGITDGHFTDNYAVLNTAGQQLDTSTRSVLANKIQVADGGFDIQSGLLSVQGPATTLKTLRVFAKGSGVGGANYCDLKSNNSSDSTMDVICPGGGVFSFDGTSGGVASIPHLVSTDIAVTSTTVVTNLNADTVDGKHANDMTHTSSTPVVNTAACIKTVGPPVVIGYCATALSGATPPTCTCN